MEIPPTATGILHRHYRSHRVGQILLQRSSRALVLFHLFFAAATTQPPVRRCSSLVSLFSRSCGSPFCSICILYVQLSILFVARKSVPRCIFEHANIIPSDATCSAVLSVFLGQSARWPFTLKLILFCFHRWSVWLRTVASLVYRPASATWSWATFAWTVVGHTSSAREEPP